MYKQATYKAFTCLFLVTLLAAQSLAQITFAKGWDRKEHSKLGERDMLRMVQRSSAAVDASRDAGGSASPLLNLLSSLLSNQRLSSEYSSLKPEEKNIIYQYLTSSDRLSPE